MFSGSDGFAAEGLCREDRCGETVSPRQSPSAAKPWHTGVKLTPPYQKPAKEARQIAGEERLSSRPTCCPEARVNFDHRPVIGLNPMQARRSFNVIEEDCQCPRSASVPITPVPVGDVAPAGPGRDPGRYPAGTRQIL
ncbi:hypothetical protein Bbelb_157130 [Branchiostoma belcheri]|nr:hypothetical protein Bbelb_157130 [Branchiostoma belcheri]